MATAPHDDVDVKLTREEFVRATTMFDDMDVNHDGVVDILEFQAVMDVIGQQTGKAYTFENVRRMFLEADRNGDGVIDYDEWMYIQKRQKAKQLGLISSEQRPSFAGTDVSDTESEVGAAEARVSITTREELHALLARLAHAADPALAQEAGVLLASVPAADDGTLPDARAMSQQQQANELARTVSNALAQGGGQQAGSTSSSEGGLNRVTQADAQAQCRVRAATEQPRSDEVQPRREQRVVSSAAQIGRPAPRSSTAAGQQSSEERTTVSSMSLIMLPMEILVAQLQYTALTTGILTSMGEWWDTNGRDWPPIALEWGRYLGWTDVLNIDLTGLNRLLQMLPASEQLTEFSLTITLVPFATLYLWTVVVIPLGLSLFMILWQKPLLSVVWMATLMAGFMLIVASSVGQFLISPQRLELLNLTISRDAFQAFLIAGLVLVSGYVLRNAFISYWSIKSELMKAKFKMRLAAERAKNKDVRMLQTSLLGRFKDAFAPRSPFVVLRSAFLSLSFLILTQARSLQRLRLREEDVPDTALNGQESEQATQLSFLVSPEVANACWVFAAGFGIHFLLCLCRCGREIITKIKLIFNTFLLAAILLLLILLFIPVTKRLLSVFVCVEQACDQGYWYPKSAHAWENAFLADASFQARAHSECTKCKFINYPATDAPDFGESCPAFPNACDGETLFVLKEDETMVCDQAHGFYAAASALMIVGFTLVVPYLFYSLVHQHTRMLKRIHISQTALATVTDVRPYSKWWRLLCCRRTTGSSEEDVAWNYRVLKTRNRAKVLYEHFQWSYRYFRVALLIHKLALVCVSLYMSSVPEASCYVTILLHALLFVVTTTQRPYFNPAANALSSAASLANVVNPILLLCAWYGVLAIDQNVSVFIMVLFNFLLPIVCLTIGLALACKKRTQLANRVQRIEAEMSDEDLQKSVHNRKKIDTELEHGTAKTIASIFMMMCCASFTAFTLILISYIFTAARGSVVQATPPTLGQTYVHVQQRPPCEMQQALADVEFLFMGSWDEFAAGCCCRDSRAAGAENYNNFTAAELYGLNATLNNQQFGQIELWTCRDLSPDNTSSTSSGVLHKLRTRVDTTGRSGLHLRPFCSPTFSPGIMPPTYDAKSLGWVVTHRNGSLAGDALW